MHSAAANDGLRHLNPGGRPRGHSSVTGFRTSVTPHDVLHAPDRSEIDTQSDTLRSGRPCDSRTPLEAKVREFLSKMHGWTSPDAVGKAEIDLLIRVPLVRSQRGPPIESISYGDLVLSGTSACQHFVPRLDTPQTPAFHPSGGSAGGPDAAAPVTAPAPGDRSLPGQSGPARVCLTSARETPLHEDRRPVRRA